jgi:hypothetical protein
MALCLILMAGAGLMIRSASNLYGAHIGVTTTGVLTLRVNLPEAKYPLPSHQITFQRRLKPRLDAIPGVEATALASSLPLGGWTSFAFEKEGVAYGEQQAPTIGAIVVSPSYFRVMRIAVSRGRTFSESDGVADSPVMMVNGSFASRFWPGANARGKRLRLVRNHEAQPWMTVIGVVPDILQNGRRPLEHDPLIYLPYAQEPQREIFIVSRSNLATSALIHAFRRAVQSVDESLPVYDVGTLEKQLARHRLSATLIGGMFSVFAIVAWCWLQSAFMPFYLIPLLNAPRKLVSGWRSGERARTSSGLFTGKA